MTQNYPYVSVNTQFILFTKKKLKPTNYEHNINPSQLRKITRTLLLVNVTETALELQI